MSENEIHADDSLSSTQVQEAPETVGERDQRIRKAQRRRRLFTILPPVLLVLGILVLLYPVIATYQNNLEQQRIAKAFSAEQTNLGPDVLKDELARADEYNRQAAEAPILDPWLESQRPNTPQYSNYLSQLDVNPVMATVKVPSADISLPIYHGTETSTLEKGVGHLFGTALPVGGEGTHTVLTGHSGLGSATMFDHLNRVKVGDVFYIEVLGRHLKYKVTDIRTVLPNETESLNKVAGKDLATLITCTPYGINTHRLLVTGERVPMDDQQVAAESAKVEPAVVQTWMIAVVVGIIAVLIATAVLWGFARKNRKKREAEAAAAAEVSAASENGEETAINTPQR
ncbi:class C sortase [Trueperella pyogenes]|uniref:class C sortase n=1 Tax=Trueperella pyogenes TaxID=1661 RepID=UPI0009BAD8F5|nr:class C sortase [Trueperella pyogenes]MBF1737145.1 class C sortase [Trueperella pyogenes]